MRRMAIVVGCAAIAVASFTIGRATAPTAPAPIVRATVPSVPAVGRSKATRPDDALQVCERRLALAEGVLRAKERAEIGDPVPFPDGVPPQYTPDGFASALNEALEACPGTGLALAHVDCSEFPCMAFFTQPRGRMNHRGRRPSGV